MAWLKAIADFFARVFSKDNAAKIEAGLKAAAPYVDSALRVVRIIAEFTPTRADDEVLALVDKYALPDLLKPGTDKTVVLRDAALAILKREFPDVPDRTLIRAIEVAYGAVRP